MSRTPILMLLVLGLATTACSDGGEEAARAADAVRELRGEIGALERRLGETENELASLKRRSAARVRARPAPVAAAVVAPVAAPDVNAANAANAEGESPTVTSAQFRDFLSTDTGQQVFAAAMREYQEKASEARRTRVVSALVQPFAKKAYLSQDQAERMSELLETAMQQMRDTWQSMRDVEPEQRSTQVAANIQRSREIREDADEELAALLSATQYEMYKEDEATFFGMPGPPRRGRDTPAR